MGFDLSLSLIHIIKLIIHNIIHTYLHHNLQFRDVIHTCNKWMIMNILVNLEYNPNLKSTSLMKSRKQIHVSNNNKNKWCVKEVFDRMFEVACVFFFVMPIA